MVDIFNFIFPDNSITAFGILCFMVFFLCFEGFVEVLCSLFGGVRR